MFCVQKLRTEVHLWRLLATSASEYSMHRLKLGKLEGEIMSLREFHVWETTGELSQSRGDRHRDMDS